MADKPKTLPIVQVDWLDAAAAAEGWETHDDVSDGKPHAIHSWGALVKSTKEHIVIVTDFDVENGKMNGGSIIPRGMVKRIKRLGTWRAK
jgi:hypothetical protein